MSKSEDKRFEDFNKVFDDLLGPVEDWSERDLNQFLAEAGVDIDEAERVLYERVSDIAGTYNARNQNIPQPIAEFLKQMRPIDLPTRDPEVATSAARKWVASLRRPKPSITAPEVAYAFRNKKDELGAKDRDVLRRLGASSPGSAASTSGSSGLGLRFAGRWRLTRFVGRCWRSIGRM